MKILLREYKGAPYVWVTAKYNNDHFTIDGDYTHPCNIISVMNDNRKNYIKCSCCGKTFKRGSRKFQIHKENAIKPQTCLGCPSLKSKNEHILSRKYTINEDGTANETIERSVELRCSRYGFWSDVDLNSDEALCSCKKRQCATATEVEIEDFFTRYPGAFDEIITSDKLLDMGCMFTLKPNRGTEVSFVSEYEYSISAYVNKLGIIDHFYVWYEDEDYHVWYSKKYDELYWDCGEYIPWDFDDMDDGMREEIKAHIAKLYN